MDFPKRIKRKKWSNEKPDQALVGKVEKKCEIEKDHAQNHHCDGGN